MRIRISRTLGAAMAAVALGLSACATQTDTTTHRGAGEFTEDGVLTAKVKTAIASDAGLGTAVEINVQTYRGVVQLSGFVDKAEQIERAYREIEHKRAVTRSLHLTSLLVVSVPGVGGNA